MTFTVWYKEASGDNLFVRGVTSEQAVKILDELKYLGIISAWVERD